MTVTTHTGGSILGHAVKRTEDQELITGAGLYTGDLPVEGSLHAVFVRSPIAHGTLGEIDVDEAKGMPGVVAVYTNADLDVADRPGLPGVVPDAMSRPHLAKGKVRFVGDIVAVVIGTTAGVDEPRRLVLRAKLGLEVLLKLGFEALAEMRERGRLFTLCSQRRVDRLGDHWRVAVRCRTTGGKGAGTMMTGATVAVVVLEVELGFKAVIDVPDGEVELVEELVVDPVDDGSVGEVETIAA